MQKNEENQVITVGKARYWWAVLYPENMIEDWEDLIAEKLQLPFAYCIHDDDLEKEFEDQTQQKRKTHVHIIIAFANTTTYKHVTSIFSLLNAPDKRAFNKVEAVRGIRHCYEYLIHNTETAKKDNKKQYSPNDRVIGNNFDIGAYEQISTSDKLRMSKEICNYIVEHDIYNFADLYMAVISNFDDAYFEILQTHSGFYERLIKGNYHRLETAYCEGIEEAQESVSEEKKHHENVSVTESVSENTHLDTPLDTLNYCPFCGSHEIKKNGKTSANTPRLRCKACGKSFILGEE